MLDTDSQQAEINLVSWNILLDYTRSKDTPDLPQTIAHQSDRLDNLIKTLAGVAVPLDVVCLQEVQGDHGKEIAKRLGYDEGMWFNHNTSKRKNEHIGMFGKLVEEVTQLQTRHDKVAAITKVGAVTIAGIHNRFEIWGNKRTEQTEDILQALENETHAVIMGDTNAVGWEKPHRLIKQAGYITVYEALGLSNPKTHPTPEYKDILYDRFRRHFIGRGMALDRIYVKGCEVLTAGSFTGDSDHRGLYATIRPV